jgi:hypothetical protein
MLVYERCCMGVAGGPSLIDEARTFRFLEALIMAVCFTFLLRCEDVPALFSKFRERHVVDEEDSVDVGSAPVLVGGTHLEAVLRDEVVVV